MKDLSNENVIQINKDGVQYLQFRKLLEYSDVITHAYSLGIDKNFRTARAKNKESLSSEERNKAINDYKKLADCLEIDYTNIVKPIQEHTKSVKIVDKKVNVDKPDFDLKEYELTDGLATNKKGFTLATTNADCILLLFFDPVKKVIANTHSGWKGTLQRISGETVRKMKEEYNCNPEDIICCICPSIRKCHFEVREDVEQLFYNEFKDLKEIEQVIIKKENTDKWLIDTVEINKIILKKEGLKEENIIDSGICSVCNSDIIHSYRTEGEEYGLCTALIELK